MRRFLLSCGFVLSEISYSGDLFDLNFCLLDTEASHGFGQKFNREKASGGLVYRWPVGLNI